MINILNWTTSIITGIIAIIIGIISMIFRWNSWLIYRQGGSTLSLLEYCIKMAHLLKNFCPYCGSETYGMKHIKTGDIAYYQCSICNKNFQ